MDRETTSLNGPRRRELVQSYGAGWAGERERAALGGDEAAAPEERLDAGVATAE